ncbi:hypothetical protein Pfo_015367 [Paulownia fortunei]|nr:hypothetical protein Pfo_015367 [Paulownia fortunei]
MADDENSGLVLKLIICLIVAASAAVVVTVYHCFTAGHMRLRRQSPPLEMQQQVLSIDNSVAELLPAHKFQKGVGLIGVDDETCAICLCEFEDGEELRTLPECVHSFHMPCIDMWLYSHSNCPMCRTIVGLGQSSPTLMHLLHPSDSRGSSITLHLHSV